MTTVELMAQAYFQRCSELSDAPISLDSLNEKSRAEVLDCFGAAFAVIGVNGPISAAVVEEFMGIVLTSSLIRGGLLSDLVDSEVRAIIRASINAISKSKIN